MYAGKVKNITCEYLINKKDDKMTDHGGIIVAIRTVREGNAFYEIDEDCMKQRKAGYSRDDTTIQRKIQGEDCENDQKRTPATKGG